MPHNKFITTTASSALGMPLQSSLQEFSAPVQDIMGRAPNWLLRSGMNTVAGMSLLMLVLAALVHYPDTISGRITVTGTNPPVAIVARQSGHLEQLIVHEHDVVSKGAVLGVIRSAVDSVQAFKIKELLTVVHRDLADKPDALIEPELTANPALGGMQVPYTDFAAAWTRHAQLQADTYVANAVSVLREQLKRKQAQIEQMARQVQNGAREQEIATTRYDRLKTLQNRDSISLADLQEAERVMLEQGRQLSVIRNTSMEAEIAAGDYEKQIEAMLHARAEDLRKSHQAVKDAAQKLAAAMDQWESDYVLRSPVDGTVGFYDFWSGEQFVTAGKEVFIVAPKISPLLGRVPVQAIGAGKIHPGQVVRVRFDDFPYKEFGIASGQVEAVSLVAQKGAHLISVRLDSPLKTNYGRQIPFKQEMMGDATIVVEDHSMLGRIFSEVCDAMINRNAH